MPVDYDLDGDGMPFSYVVNPTRLLISLKGDKSAVEKAVNVAKTDKEIMSKDSESAYEKFAISEDSPYTVIDATVNNYIPQLCEDIEKIEGLDELVYLTYAQDFTHIITNDRKGIILSDRKKYNIPEDYEVEIDDEDTPFPEIGELSLPDPMAP